MMDKIKFYIFVFNFLLLFTSILFVTGQDKKTGEKGLGREEKSAGYKDMTESGKPDNRTKRKSLKYGRNATNTTGYPRKHLNKLNNITESIDRGRFKNATDMTGYPWKILKNAKNGTEKPWEHLKNAKNKTGYPWKNATNGTEKPWEHLKNAKNKTGYPWKNATNWTEKPWEHLKNAKNKTGYPWKNATNGTEKPWRKNMTGPTSKTTKPEEKKPSSVHELTVRLKDNVNLKTFLSGEILKNFQKIPVKFVTLMKLVGKLPDLGWKCKQKISKDPLDCFFVREPGQCYFKSGRLMTMIDTPRMTYSFDIAVAYAALNFNIPMNRSGISFMVKERTVDMYKTSSTNEKSTVGRTVSLKDIGVVLASQMKFKDCIIPKTFKMLFQDLCSAAKSQIFLECDLAPRRSIKVGNIFCFPDMRVPLTSTFTFLPPLNLGGNNAPKEATVKIKYGCPNRKMKNAIDSESAIPGFVKFIIKQGNRRPVFKALSYAFAPYIPFNLAENVGVKIAEIMDGPYDKYGKGYNTKKPVKRKFSAPLIEDDNMTMGGLVIYKGRHMKSVKYTCNDDGNFQPIIPPMILRRNCMIKILPGNEDVFEIEVFAFDGSIKIKQVDYRSIVEQNSFSAKPIKLYFLRENCDGVLDKACECRRKDSCGKCLAPGRNLTEVEECGFCAARFERINEKSLHNLVKTRFMKDCNGDCGGTAKRLCGECVGGKTGRETSEFLDDCGNCKNLKMECSADSLVITKVAPKNVDEGFNNKIVMCLNKKQTEKMQCELKNTDGVCSMVQISNKMEKFKMARGKLRYNCKRLDALIKPLGPCRAMTVESDCKAGNYQIYCTIKDKKVVSKHNVTIHDFRPITVKSISPTTYKSGINHFNVSGSKFNVDKMYSCCYSKCTRQPCCVIGKVIDPRTLHCRLYIANNIKASVDLTIQDCVGRRSNSQPITFDCVDPGLISYKVFNGYFQMKFNSPIFRSSGCRKMDYKTRGKTMIIHEPILNGNRIIKIPNNCLKCSTTIGYAEFPIEECYQKNETIVLAQCNNLHIKTSIDAKGPFTWVMSNGSNEMNKMLSKKRGRNLFLHRNTKHKWSSVHSAYIFSRCHKDVLGRSCCTNYRVYDTSTASSYNYVKYNLDTSTRCSLIESITTKSQKLKATVYECGKRLGTRDMDVQWTINVNNGEKILQPEPFPNFVLKLNDFAGNEDRNISVNATITRGNSTCMTKTLLYKVKGRNRKLIINRGRQTMCVPCERKELTLVARLFEKGRPARSSVEDFRWSCITPSGENCFASDVSGQRKMKVNLNELECQMSYNFQVFYKELVATLQLDRAEVCSPVVRRCFERRKQNVEDRSQRKFTCVIFGQNVKHDNVSIALVPPTTESETISTSDFAEVFNISLIQTSFKEFGKNRYYFTVAVPTQEMVSFMKYRFEVSVGEVDEISTKHIELYKAGKLKNCSSEMFPATSGIASNTSFQLSVSNCLSGGQKVFCKLEFENQGKWVTLIPTKDNCVLDIGALAQTRPDKKQRLRWCANVDVDGNRDGDSCGTIDVNLEDGENKTDLETITKALEDSDTHLENGEEDKFLQTVVTTTAKLESASSHGEETTAFIEKSLDTIIYKLDEKSEQTFEVARSIFPKDPSKSLKRKAKDFMESTSEIASEPLVRRRRRSLSVDESEKQLLTYTELETKLAIFENTLFPIKYEQEDQDLKASLLGQEIIMKRSIIKNLQDVSSTEGKIAFSHQRYETIPSSMAIQMTDDYSVSFDQEISTKYTAWTCSESDDVCQGFYLASFMVQGDIWSASPPDEMQLKTPVVSVTLISPLQDYEFPNIEDTSVVIPIQFDYNEVITDNSSVRCYKWVQSEWSALGCSTTVDNSTSPAKVQCSCSSSLNVPVSVFKISQLAILKIVEKEAQLSITTTTPVPESNATTDANTESGNNANTSTSATTPTKNTTSTSAGNSNIQTKTSTFSFSFQADFDTFVGKYNSLELARKDVCDAVKKIDPALTSITNCTISKGSVIVNYSLTSTEESLTKLTENLSSKFTNGYTMNTTHGGYQVQAKSFYRDSQYKGSVVSDEDDDSSSLLAIVISVTVVVIVLVIILVGVLVYRKKTRMNRKVNPHSDYDKMKESPNSSKTAISHGVANPAYQGEK